MLLMLELTIAELELLIIELIELTELAVISELEDCVVLIIVLEDAGDGLFRSLSSSLQATSAALTASAAASLKESMFIGGPKVLVNGIFAWASLAFGGNCIPHKKITNS